MISSMSWIANLISALLLSIGSAFSGLTHVTPPVAATSTSTSVPILQQPPSATTKPTQQTINATTAHTTAPTSPPSFQPSSAPPITLTKERLLVSPRNGIAPLTVTARFDGCSPELDWGDGTPHWLTPYAMESCDNDTDPSTMQVIETLTHTYSSPGTYIIDLDDKYTQPLKVVVTEHPSR